MDDKKTVSYLVFESTQTRSDRIIHRLIIGLLISVILLFVSNGLWLLAWTNHNETHIENSDGTTNYIGNDGTINGDKN